MGSFELLAALSAFAMIAVRVAGVKPNSAASDLISISCRAEMAIYGFGFMFPFPSLYTEPCFVISSSASRQRA